MAKDWGQIRGKIWGDNPSELLKALDIIRNAFAPYVTTSDIRDSRQGDYHAMFSIYEIPEEEEG